MISPKLTEVLAGVRAQACLIPPLLAAVAFAWADVRTRRIPNYLTLSTALAGLGFQLGYAGWGGLLSGLLGLGVGLGLLILPYGLGGVGAGDVKALAALGTWMNPRLTLEVFLYMALAGGGLALVRLWRQGRLAATLRAGGEWLGRRIFLYSPGGQTTTGSNKDFRLPYGPALALGMAMVFLKGA